MDHDLYNLDRFLVAQETVFEDVLAELGAGQKTSHWMWFIFPQICGLGKSETSIYYSISGEDEARQYLNHPILGPRLVHCSEMVLAIEGKSALEIFGFLDDLKLKSCMTLFACITRSDSVFVQVLWKYFNGERDKNTLLIGNFQA